jgi:YafQ family addiction module toxin component|tara:strand:+ start:932 stop:1195 length:264 start_codon:yes stop_codon:yes gene_type:complete
MYSFDIKEQLDKKFQKLSKKNPTQLKIIHNKIQEVIQNPQHFKNLRKPFQRYKRVHIDKSFVLIFSVDEENKKVIFEEFDHHDRIYQ